MRGAIQRGDRGDAQKFKKNSFWGRAWSVIDKLGRWFLPGGAFHSCPYLLNDLSVRRKGHMWKDLIKSFHICPFLKHLCPTFRHALVPIFWTSRTSPFCSHLSSLPFSSRFSTKSRCKFKDNYKDISEEEFEAEKAKLRKEGKRADMARRRLQAKTQQATPNA